MTNWEDVSEAYRNFLDKFDEISARDGSTQHGGLNAEYFVSAFGKFDNLYLDSTARVLFMQGVLYHRLSIIKILVDRYTAETGLAAEQIAYYDIFESGNRFNSPTEAAEYYYSLVLQLRSDWGPARYNLASLQLMCGDRDHAAENFLISAQNSQIHSAYAYWHLAMIAEDIGNLDKAEEYYLAAVENDQHFGNAHRRVADFLRKRGKMELALLHYSKSLEFFYPLAPELFVPVPNAPVSDNVENENLFRTLLEMKSLSGKA